MTTLTDAFTGTNGAAPNASNWTTYVSTGAIADIQSNALRLLTGANGAFNDWARLVSTIGTQANVNVAVDVFPQGTAETYFRVPARATTSAGSTIENNGYLFEVNYNGNVVISKAVSGTITSLGSAAISGYAPGVTVHCVFDITGTTLTAYCWTTGGQPGTPTLQVTDSTYSAAGYTGLGVSGGSTAIGRDWRIDNYSITYGTSGVSGAASPTAAAAVSATGAVQGATTSSLTATSTRTATGSTGVAKTAALTVTAAVTAAGATVTGLNTTSTSTAVASVTAAGAVATASTAAITATAVVTPAGSLSGSSTTASRSTTATITASASVGRATGAALTATATITIPPLSSGSKSAALLMTARVTADGFSTMLPSTGLLWIHNGITYVPRRAWRYDANGVLKPVTFNRA